MCLAEKKKEKFWEQRMWLTGNSRRHSKNVSECWQERRHSAVVKEAFTVQNLSGGCCNISFIKAVYQTSTLFLFLLKNEAGRGGWPSSQEPERGFNKGSSCIWTQKYFSELQFQRTHCWNLLDFKPLEDPRKGVCGRVCGPFNPHRLMERRGNAGQLPGV